MDIISVVFILIVIGILLHYGDRIPMNGDIRKIIYVVVILAVVVWLLNVFGLLPLRGGPSTQDLKIR